MNTPHLGLLRAYGNTDVFFKKASMGPRLADQVGGLVAGGLLTKVARGVPPLAMKAPPAPNVGAFTVPQKPSLKERAMNALSPAKPAVETGKGAPTINPMEGPKGAPAPAAAGDAPAAAPKGGGGLPWNRMLALGGMLGAGYLGLKGLGMGLNVLGGGHGGPASYGAAPGGYMPPMGVNGYGYPQQGTPLM